MKIRINESQRLPFGLTERYVIQVLEYVYYFDMDDAFELRELMLGTPAAFTDHCYRKLKEDGVNQIYRGISLPEEEFEEGKIISDNDWYGFSSWTTEEHKAGGYANQASHEREFILRQPLTRDKLLLSVDVLSEIAMKCLHDNKEIQYLLDSLSVEDSEVIMKDMAVKLIPENIIFPGK